MAVVELAVLFSKGHFVDHNGPGGMKTSKCLSLRENADPTMQASAPAAGSPGAVDPGIVVGHELGHARGVMTGAMPGQTDGDSLRIENKIRVLEDPNAPIRIIHDCPPGVCQ